jgi:hypothetical protein
MASNQPPMAITVLHDPDPPQLTPGAAVVLLRILRTEQERVAGQQRREAA